MAEQLLVEDPVCVLWANVDVDHGTGEEPRDVSKLAITRTDPSDASPELKLSDMGLFRDLLMELLLREVTGHDDAVA